MHRTVLASLALVALVHAAPITGATKTVAERQLIVGDPTTGGITNPKPTFIIFPPITGPIEPSTKRDTEVKERQFSWGDPSDQPPVPGSGDSTIGTPITGGLNPSNKKRQVIISGADPTKAKIEALELEYETLLHQFGTQGPKPIQNRLKAIKDELLHKYGITIIQSPDGTTTTFTPGKRDFTFPGGPIPGGPLIPAEPFPGGPLVPEKPVPGGPLEPST
ncbi:hypothetical protein HD806DRAFT_530774 [Xylariaceae sp. AK1471]|nr:hypothetical protein HD806DRAFT_530774 [Xylariaceae sp. AK1471]